MKNSINILLFSILLLSLNSCSDDDNDIIDSGPQLLDFVDEYTEAFFNLTPYPILSTQFPESREVDYLDFLDELNANMVERGAGDLIGYKLGFTGAERPFNAPKPFWGRMYSSFEVDNESTISKSETFIAGAIGFEVAVIIGEEVDGFITADRAREVVSGIAPAFEFADIGFQGNMEDVSFLDVIAMNTGGRLYILGETTSLEDLETQGIDPDQIAVTGSFEGEPFLETRTGEAVDGLFKAVSFLSGELGARGISLQPGDIIFSGALLGDQEEGFGTYTGDYGPLGTIEFTLTE